MAFRCHDLLNHDLIARFEKSALLRQHIFIAGHDSDSAILGPLRVVHDSDLWFCIVACQR